MKSINQIKNKCIFLPRNKYNLASIYLQCLQLSSYKYFILTAQSKSSDKIRATEKISFTYYLKKLRKKYSQHKLAIIVSRPNI